MDEYYLLRPDPVYQTSRIKYFSSRAPDDQCVLIALCDTEESSLEFIRIYREIHMRQAEMFAEAGSIPKCTITGGCKHRRNCLRLEILPQSAEEIEPNCFELRQRCFDLGSMVLLKEVADLYYFDMPSACRIIVNLLILIEKLIILRVKISINVDNLLLDPNTADILILDWSEATIVDCLSMSNIRSYYQQILQVAEQLTGAECTDGHWQTVIPCESPILLRIFAILQSASTCQFEEDSSGSLCDAIEGFTKEREWQKEQLEEIIKLLAEAKLETRKPYHLKKREK